MRRVWKTAVLISAIILITGLTPAIAQQRQGSAPANQSVARFDGLWKFSAAGGECNFEFGPAFKLHGGKFEGMIASSRDNGLRYLYGQIDASGKVSAFASGDFVSVRFAGQLSGDKGSGTGAASGETECSSIWRAIKIGGQ